MHLSIKENEWKPFPISLTIIHHAIVTQIKCTYYIAKVTRVYIAKKFTFTTLIDSHKWFVTDIKSNQ